jgi:acyl-coenzyme A synthetase/AMP-(fatty) acid ligase
VARTDDIIKRRGEKVSPVEVENLLMGIDGVLEAAVVGVPNELLDEAIGALAVLDSGSDLTGKRIELTCRAKLESLVVPDQTLVVPALPKTESGKIRRAGLRDLAAEPQT